MPRILRGEDEAFHHPPPALDISEQTEPAEVDLHLSTGLTVGHPNCHATTILTQERQQLHGLTDTPHPTLQT
jgi:hypothetical protein